MMQTRTPALPVALLMAFTVCCLAHPIAAAADDGIDYVRQVRPLLAAHCFACHGADEGSRESGLRLDVEAGATAELESGKRAIVPGSLADSELYRRVTSKDPDEVMPPKDSGHTLKPEEIEVLRAWID